MLLNPECSIILDDGFDLMSLGKLKLDAIERNERRAVNIIEQVLYVLLKRPKYARTLNKVRAHACLLLQ